MKNKKRGNDYKDKNPRGSRDETFKKKPYKKPFQKKKPYQGKIYKDETIDTGPKLIRLNKYIADAGICSRREADKIIESGVIKINGKIVTELGTKVSSSDIILYGGQKLRSEQFVYLLLNKPKNYITTTDDPFGRNTVMRLVANACKERIFPVGRLDRNTLGLLLFTNDGDLAKKLTHPKHNVKKLYHVVLNKNVALADLQKISDGLELDDGPIKVDAISYIEGGQNKNEVGIEVHSGKNRIVRRIFESLNYKVEKLDRVIFAGLTKKNLTRGRWRFLTEREVSFLKMSK